MGRSLPLDIAASCRRAASQVNDYKEEIETTSVAATQEHVLEEMLGKVESAWKNLEFVVNPYKEFKDVFILGGVDDVMAVLEETQARACAHA